MLKRLIRRYRVKRLLKKLVKKNKKYKPREIKVDEVYIEGMKWLNSL